MKYLISLLLLTLIVSDPLSRNSTGPIDALESFFDQLGYDTFDDFIIKAVTDSLNIKQLIEDILKEYGQAPRTWVNTADVFSKIGRVMDVAASNIKENANNTRLNEQFDRAMNYINDVINNPNFLKIVQDNVTKNGLQITWAMYDLKNLYTTGDFTELGKRSANLFVLIFKDADKRPTNSLRLLADQKVELKGIINKLKSADCGKKLFWLSWELVKLVSNMKNMSIADAYNIISQMFQVAKECFIS